MNGTEKQIEWATKIKAEATVELARVLREFEERFQTAKASGEMDKVKLQAASAMVEDYRDILEKVLNKNDSKWWIDNRTRLSRHIFADIRNGEVKL